jgi:hypothetical protein
MKVHYPEKGEALAAAEALDARLRATAPADGGIVVAEVNRRSGEIRGEEAAMRGAYGDLFDIGELADLAEGPVQAFIADIAFGTAPDAALRSMFLMAVAHGVLMERARWQR